MTEFQYEQQIIQGMLNLHELVDLDIIWLDSILDKVKALINHPLPTMLGFSKLDIFKIIKLLKSSDAPTYCYASTKNQLEYIFILLVFKGKEKGLIKIGPFLTTQINHNFISKLMTINNFPLRYRKELYDFYSGLNIVHSNYASNLGFIAYNLLVNNAPIVLMVNYQSKSLIPTVDNVKLHNLNQELIEKRYEHENIFRHAISTGNLELYKKLVKESHGLFNLNNRMPDNPLRLSKNLAFVVNTLCRISANEGGLHPLYLHSISEKYAILIEKATTRSQINKLLDTMIKEYIKILYYYAYKGVSKPIKKVIDYINFHIENHLTVSTLAEKFNYKPSNLANQFKNEMNMTISQFINKVRVREACYYLEHSDLSINKLSYKVGFLDVNYFARIFKKIKGISPSVYRQQEQK